MRTLLILAFSFATTSAFAAVGAYNPVGNYGNAAGGKTPFKLDPPGKWKPEWSEAFFKCANDNPDAQKMFDKMANGEVQDLGPGKNWCPQSEVVFKRDKTPLFQLAFAKELSKMESTLNPEIMNSKSPNPPAVGLFQIGPSDVEMYRCKTPEGKPMYTGAKYNRVAMRNKATSDKDPRVKMLKDGRNNVCCMVQIAAYWSKKKNVFALKKDGIVGKFWEPARVQNTKGARGGELASKVNNICTAMAGSDMSYFTSAELEASRRVPASSTPDTRVADSTSAR